MKASHLIEILQKFPPETKVNVFDGVGHRTYDYVGEVEYV